MSTYPFLPRICGRHYSGWHTFLARYDDKPPKVRGSRRQEASVFPPYRVGTYVVFSDRSSWVVTFDQQTLVVLPPQMVLDTSLLARDPLYTGSLLVAPRKGHFGEPCIELRGVAHPHPELRPTRPIRVAVPGSTGDHVFKSFRFAVRARTWSWIPNCHASSKLHKIVPRARTRTQSVTRI